MNKSTVYYNAVAFKTFQALPFFSGITFTLEPVQGLYTL